MGQRRGAGSRDRAHRHLQAGGWRLAHSRYLSIRHLVCSRSVTAWRDTARPGPRIWGSSQLGSYVVATISVATFIAWQGLGQRFCHCVFAQLAAATISNLTYRRHPGRRCAFLASTLDSVSRDGPKLLHDTSCSNSGHAASGRIRQRPRPCMPYGCRVGLEQPDQNPVII
jgi:hypothetical protein